MVAMREEDCLHTGAAVLPRDAQVSAERFTTTNRQLLQLTLKGPGPQENMEFSGILGLRFPPVRNTRRLRGGGTRLPHST